MEWGTEALYAWLKKCRGVASKWGSGTQSSDRKAEGTEKIETRPGEFWEGPQLAAGALGHHRWCVGVCQALATN